MKSTHISIRFPPELLAKLRELAVKENRTLSNLIVKTMQQATAKKQKQDKESELLRKLEDLQEQIDMPNWKDRI